MAKLHLMEDFKCLEFSCSIPATAKFDDDPTNTFLRRKLHRHLNHVLGRPMAD